MMGIAMGKIVQGTLAASGITITGIRWVWRPGWKGGGTYPPHLDRDGVAVYNPDGFVGEPEFGLLPGDGRSPNSDWCGCTYRWLLRGADGRFMKEQEA